MSKDADHSTSETSTPGGLSRREVLGSTAVGIGAFAATGFREAVAAPAGDEGLGNLLERANADRGRLAQGASRGQVLHMIFLEQMKLLLSGVGIGLAGWLACAHSMSGLLFGVKSGDLASIAISIAAISAATLLAAYLPARRAARLDPMVVLRED